MTHKRKSLGKLGEELAVSFLQKKGYKITETNYKIKGMGEIDIICEPPRSKLWRKALKRPKVIFVEVRTKSSNFFGTPEESITPKKQQKLTNLAHCYLNIKKWHYKDFAIDGVFVGPVRNPQRKNSSKKIFSKLAKQDCNKEIVFLKNKDCSREEQISNGVETKGNGFEIRHLENLCQ